MRFWRLLFNKIPTKIERAYKDNIDILIIYASDTKELRYDIIKNHNDDNLLIIKALKIDTRELKDNLLSRIPYNGIYILYSDSIIEPFKKINSDYLLPWANEFADRPIVYCNLSKKEVIGLDYGQIEKNEAIQGVWRLLERGYKRASLWRGQSKMFHSFSIALAVLLLISSSISVDWMKNYRINSQKITYPLPTIIDSETENAIDIRKNFPSDKSALFYFLKDKLEIIKNEFGLSSRGLKLTFWCYNPKIDSIHAFITTINAKEKRFCIDNNSIIGSAFNNLNTFIIWKENPSFSKNEAAAWYLEKRKDKVCGYYNKSHNIQLNDTTIIKINGIIDGSLIGYAINTNLHSTNRNDINHKYTIGICLQIPSIAKNKIGFISSEKLRIMLAQFLNEMRYLPNEILNIED